MRSKRHSIICPIPYKNADKGQNMQQTIDLLEEAKDSISTSMDNLQDATQVN